MLEAHQQGALCHAKNQYIAKNTPQLRQKKCGAISKTAPQSRHIIK
jgi:hypothetical protein